MGNIFLGLSWREVGKQVRHALVALVVLSSPAVAAGIDELPSELPGLDQAPPFVAEVVVSNDQVSNATFRLFYRPGKVRMEPGGAGAGQGVIISDLRARVTYCDIEGQWFKVPIDVLGAAGVAHGHFQTKKLGRKTIDGKQCDGYLLTGVGGPVVVEQWLWGKYPVLARIQGPQGVTTARYLSLQPTVTPDSFFQVPPGAQIRDLGSLEGLGQQALPDANQDLQNLLKQRQDLQELLKQSQ